MLSLLWSLVSKVLKNLISTLKLIANPSAMEISDSRLWEFSQIAINSYQDLVALSLEQMSCDLSLLPTTQKEFLILSPN